MEYARRVVTGTPEAVANAVLILVLMEYARRVTLRQIKIILM